MLSRGRKPSRTAWRVTENAPEMTAWEAITVATVARNTIGSRAQWGSSKKNGLSIVAGERRISAHRPRELSVSAGDTNRNQARRIGGGPEEAPVRANGRG